jgi:hypothetical protein
VSYIGNSLNKLPSHRRHAALQILALAKAMAAVCALPDTDRGRFVFQPTANSGHWQPGGFMV